MENRDEIVARPRPIESMLSFVFLWQVHISQAIKKNKNKKNEIHK